MAASLGELSDAELISRSQFGSDDEKSAAFEELFVRYDERLLKHITYETYPRGYSREEREDVSSETWLRAWDRIRSFEDRGASLLAWLKGIAHNVIRHYERRRYRTIPFVDAGEEPAASSEPEDDAIAHLTRDQIKAVVAASIGDAPEGFQIILEASFLTEPPMPVPDIMEMCGWTQGQLYTKKSRAKDWLEAHLLKCHGAGVIADLLDAT